MRLIRPFTASSLLLALMMQAAHAHAVLLSATPAVGSTQAAPPREIVLRFSEAIEPRFSTLILTSEAGVAIATAPPALSPDDPSVLVVRLASPLRTGSYQAKWRAVSVDTHLTEGGFSFTVK